MFVAHALQGLARGAALLEFEPRRDPVHVSPANGVASAGGVGLGVLGSAALVELLPSPRVLPYVALLALIATALAAAWPMNRRVLVGFRQVLLCSPVSLRPAMRPRPSQRGRARAGRLRQPDSSSTS